ncbi:piggyBac transposable element-derived protein 4-like isoform X1 [Electrophorus electricus]|uniref:piggyBac transposable element-derived protein 4-like isoform X1 n=1 Tax=Electrophorus electricus TaxID=8005 RepID=UPI0015D0112F|nr:piggyBac transposable element-derived protein 4-like isoform X1 [Electrophorus electricus]
MDTEIEDTFVLSISMDSEEEDTFVQGTDAMPDMSMDSEIEDTFVLNISMDSEEEDTFVQGTDAMPDMEADSSSIPSHGISPNSSDPVPGPSASTLPQCEDTPHTSALSQSVNTPHTSAGGQAGVRGSRNTSPPPAKRRLLRSPSPSPGKPSGTSPRQKFRATHRKWRATLAERYIAPVSHSEREDRWRDASEEDERPPPFLFHPRKTPGVQLGFQTEYSPLEIFQLFFHKEVIRTLCRNTNKYAAQRTAAGMKGQWTDIDANEMFKYLSITVYLGLVRPSCIQDLWRRDCLHSFPFPAFVMTGKRYIAISANLHMSDPAEDVRHYQRRGQPEYDRLFTLKPLQDQILTSCQAYYHPRQNISIHERMVATKARIGIKQYMKNKPTRRGFKLFVLTESVSGYTYNFSIYAGKARNPSGNGLSFDAVVNLIHVPTLGTGYTVYTDNFYTSSKLFLHLQSMGFGACGTISESRIGFPKTTVNALPKKVDRGGMRWIRAGTMLFVKWRDTQDVKMCSTVHKAYDGEFVRRRVKSENGTWSFREVPIPEPVRQYNKFMGGVDSSDTLMKYFSMMQKTRCWYVKLFLHFIDIAVVNSFIIHKEMVLARHQKPLTQKRFREVLCMELAGGGQPQESLQVPIQTKGPEQMQNGCLPVPVCKLSTEPHLKASQGRRKCVHCKMKTMFRCRSCNVSLCMVVDRLCFTEWHDKNLKS